MRNLLALLYLTVLAAASIYAQRPPAAVPAAAPPEVFSSGRAMRCVRAIAREPHPTGSPEAAAVRRYVVAQLRTLGLEPSIQTATGIRLKAGPPYRAATVENIIARLKGTGAADGKAILLAAHTDSVPHSFSASDDGAGVAALLETIRALRAGPPLKRDVIFLFSDGEELGLLGAQAFVARHPFSRDVGLVLNFEARGHGGASYMFETSRGNGLLIRALQQAAPHPVATSLMYSVYQSLPNDTDLSVFKAAGFPGLNFAFVDGLQYYHSPNDSSANLDERSLQQQGEYALSMTRTFGGAPRLNARSTDAVYFNTIGNRLVSYPVSWARPLAALALVLWAGVFGAGMVRGLTLRGAARQAARFGGAVLAACAAIQALFLFNRCVRPSTTATTAADLYFMGSICAAAAIVFSMVAPTYRQRANTYQVVLAEELNIGVSFWWLLLAVVAAIRLPGASYLFVWPLLFSLVGAAARLAAAGKAPRHATIVVVLEWISVIPAIFLAAPTVYALFSLIALSFPAALLLPVLLVLGLVLPVFSAPTTPSLPAAGVSAAVILLLMAASVPLYSNGNQRRDSILYLCDADRAESFWVNADGVLDEWTARFFQWTIRENVLEEYPPFRSLVPRVFRSRFRTASAPLVPLAPPVAVLTGQTTRHRERSLSLRLRSARRARVLLFFVDPVVEVLSARVNGLSLPVTSGPTHRPFTLIYTACPPAGISLEINVRGTAPVDAMIADSSDGLPTIRDYPVRARPSYYLPTTWSDVTAVTRRMRL